MRSFTSLCPFILIFSLTACFYSPSEEYLSNVLSPNTEEYSIRTNTSGNTISVISSDPIFFYVSMPVKSEILDVVIDSDFNYLGAISFNSGSSIQWIPPTVNGQRLEGMIRLTVIVSSGSGSLADQVGSEIVVITREWNYTADLTPPAPISVSNIESQEGDLIISWDLGQKINYKSYRLEINHFDSNNQLYHSKLVDFNTNQTPRYIDRDFLTGRAEYTLTQIMQGLEIVGPTVSHEYDFNLSFELEEDRSLTLFWNTLPHYNNVSELSLQIDLRIPGLYIPHMLRETLESTRQTELNTDFAIAVEDGYQWIIIMTIKSNTNPQRQIEERIIID